MGDWTLSSRDDSSNSWWFLWNASRDYSSTVLIDLVSPICRSGRQNPGIFSRGIRAPPTIRIYIVSNEYLCNFLNRMVVTFGILITLQSNIALEFQWFCDCYCGRDSGFWETSNQQVRINIGKMFKLTSLAKHFRVQERQGFTRWWAFKSL